MALSFVNFRLMYWSDWSESQTTKAGKIERASMDGTGRQVFVDTDLKWPNGLSLDMPGKKLYWCDAYFNKIERINLDGSQREVPNTILLYYELVLICRKFSQTILEGNDLNNPYGLAYFNNMLFWTEMQNGSVVKFYLQNKTLEILSLMNPPIYDIVMFDNSSQSGSMR